MYARHNAFTHRVAGVHHPVGDTPREIVLKQRPAVPDDVPVALPADQAGDTRHDRIMADETVYQNSQGSADQHQQRHADQHRDRIVQSGGTRARLHYLHEAADEDRDEGVDQRHRQAGGKQSGIKTLRLADEVPVKRKQA